MSLWKIVPILLISVGCILGSALHSKVPRKLLSSENSHRFENSQYYIENILEASSSRAQVFCKFHGMDLVSIESPEEDEFLSNVITEKRGNNTSSDRYWTSGHKLGEKWFWTGIGSFIEYYNSGMKEPNSYGGNQRCINIIDRKGSVAWDVHNCDEGFGFICERNATYFEQFCDNASSLGAV